MNVKESGMDVAYSCDYIDKAKCNRVNICLNGRRAHGLLDTGATVSCITKNVFVQFKCAPMEKSQVSCVLGVGGVVTPVLGKVQVPVRISDLNMFQEFLVLPGSSKPEIILGKNFLHQQHAKWDFTTNVVTFNDMVSVELVSIDNLSQEKVCFIRTTETITLPGKHEAIIPVKISNRGKNKISTNLPTGVITPTGSLSTKHGVTGARCVVQPTDRSCCYRLLNPFTCDTTLPKDNIFPLYVVPLWRKWYCYSQKAITTKNFSTTLQIVKSNDWYSIFTFVNTKFCLFFWMPASYPDMFQLYVNNNYPAVYLCMYTTLQVNILF